MGYRDGLRPGDRAVRPRRRAGQPWLGLIQAMAVLGLCLWLLAFT